MFTKYLRVLGQTLSSEQVYCFIQHYMHVFLNLKYPNFEEFVWSFNLKLSTQIVIFGVENIMSKSLTANKKLFMGFNEFLCHIILNHNPEKWLKNEKNHSFSFISSIKNWWCNHLIMYESRERNVDDAYVIHLTSACSLEEIQPNDSRWEGSVSDTG